MKLSKELQELLDNTMVLTEEDLKELEEANRALCNDPEFIKEYEEDMKEERILQLQNALEVKEKHLVDMEDLVGDWNIALLEILALSKPRQTLPWEKDDLPNLANLLDRINQVTENALKKLE